MILTGSEIEMEIRRKRIVIEPFRKAQLNPNSYNYGIGSVLKMSTCKRLDARVPSDWREVRIPAEVGLILHPGRLYLGNTQEIIGSEYFVTSLIGRSSLGRLGMYLQVSADMANLGRAHKWTLEINVVQALRIYPDMIVGQVSFWRPHGSRARYEGVYASFDDPTPTINKGGLR